MSAIPMVSNTSWKKIDDFEVECKMFILVHLLAPLRYLSYGLFRFHLFSSPPFSQWSDIPNWSVSPTKNVGVILLPSILLPHKKSIIVFLDSAFNVCFKSGLFSSHCPSLGPSHPHLLMASSFIPLLKFSQNMPHYLSNNQRCQLNF